MSATETGLVIDGWLTGRNVNTARAYRTRIGEWVSWCEQHDVSPLAPSESDCRAYHDDLLGHASIRRNHSVGAYVTAVRSLLAYARRHGAAPERDPWEAVKVAAAPTKSTTPYLTAPEHRQLVAYASTSAAPIAYALVRVCGILAHRIGAALAFRLDDLTSTGTGWQYRLRAKGSVELVMPVDDETVDAIRAAVGERETGLLFPSTGDPTRPIDQTTARRWIRQLCLAAGVTPVPPHGLRHSAITRALEETGDHHAARDLAGHSSASTTARYDRRSDPGAAALAAVAAVTRTPATIPPPPPSSWPAPAPHD